MNNSLNEFKAVGTLIIKKKKNADRIISKFSPNNNNNEIDSLLALSYNDIRFNYKNLISHKKINDAKKIFPSAQVQPNYIFKHIFSQRDDICDILSKIPNTYKMICQVETPKRELPQYKDINIGFSSNGKIDYIDKSLLDCSIRETYEETQELFDENMYCPLKQLKKREKLGFPNLSLNFKFQKVFCYILVI